MADNRSITVAGNFSQSVNVSNSLSNGDGCVATNNSHAEGFHSTATGQYSHADGYRAEAVDDRSYVWSGRESSVGAVSNGAGTYNIYTGNGNGLNGIYVNGDTLTQQISSSFNPYFSNKVLTNSAKNEFTGNNIFNTVSITGQLVVHGANSSSALGGIVTAETLGNAYVDNLKRLATIGYVRNMMDSSAATADTEFVHRENTVAVGSDVNPVYVDANGTVKASAATVGNPYQPIYMNDGKMTPVSADMGGPTTPVYMSNGTFVPCSREIPDVESFTRLIAASSGTYSVSVGSTNPYTLNYRKWYRLYSDGWCEQGGTVPFQQFQGTDIEKTVTNYVYVPYKDDTYQILVSTWDHEPNARNDAWTYSTNKSEDCFDMAIGYAGGDATHIVTYGGANWQSMGYVSEQTKVNILNGLVYNGPTHSWGGRFILDVTDGENSIQLSPGSYTIWMVGGGGKDATINDVATNSRFRYTGSAGASIVATITLNTQTAAYYQILESDAKRCIFYLASGNNTDFTAMMYTEFGHDGGPSSTNYYSAPGGMYEIADDARVKLIKGGVGENGLYSHEWIDGGDGQKFPGGKAYSYMSSKGLMNGNYGNSSYYADLNPTVPGKARILLFQHT